MKTRLDTGAKKDLNLFNNVYAGIIPALLGGVPAAAVFFGTKDLFRNIFRYVRTFDSKSIDQYQFPFLISNNSGSGNNGNNNNKIHNGGM